MAKPNMRCQQWTSLVVVGAVVGVVVVAAMEGVVE